MRTLEDQLSRYAAYHRDRRNVATHWIGIPLIVAALGVLLSRPVLELGPLQASPALLASVLAAAYYLRLDRPFGLVMTLWLGIMLAFGAWVSDLGTARWLWTGAGLFVVGWILQLIGHGWEGRRPAFVDDVVGLLIGPLFLLAELAFALGLRRGLQARIDACRCVRRVAADRPRAGRSRGA